MYVRKSAISKALKLIFCTFSLKFFRYFTPSARELNMDQQFSDHILEASPTPTVAETDIITT